MLRSFFHNAIKATIMLILFVFETREKGGKKKKSLLTIVNIACQVYVFLCGK